MGLLEGAVMVMGKKAVFFVLPLGFFLLHDVTTARCGETFDDVFLLFFSVTACLAFFFFSFR